jgi:hypothetical protein
VIPDSAATASVGNLLEISSQVVKGRKKQKRKKSSGKGPA